METRVRKKSNKYKAVNRSSAQDKKLSLKAKGLMFYFLSKPDGRRGQKYDVINKCKDGDSSVRTALKELRAAGYIKLITVRDECGVFKGKYYEVIDQK